MRFSQDLFYKPTDTGQWITVDLHIHSSYSGGDLRAEDILNFATRFLFDAIGVSDHYEIDAAIEAEKVKTEKPTYPDVIVSQEVSAGDHFHLLIIGSDHSWPEVNRYSLLDQIQQHHQTGGAVILAHPWTIPKTVWANEYLKRLIDDCLLDGVELFNTSILELNEARLQSLKDFWNEWVIPNQLGVYGGSDFHHFRKARWLGTGKTFLKVCQPGATGILAAIRGRRAVAGLAWHQVMDLDWLGSGNNFIYGCDPWYTEIRKLIQDLEQQVNHCYQNSPQLNRFLLQLIANGQFQHIQNLLR